MALRVRRPLLTPGGIEYAELTKPAPGQVWISKARAEARVTYLVSYSEWLDFVYEVFGAPTGGSGPWSAPWEFQGLGIYADDFQVEFQGASTDTTVPYLEARIEVSYRNPAWDAIEDGVAYSISEQGSSSMVTQPWGSLIWDDDGSPVNLDWGFNVATVDLRITRYRMGNRASIVSTLLPYLTENSVNNATFAGYPAGHVRFATWNLDSTVSVFGLAQSTASFICQFRSVPWNAGVKPGAGSIVSASRADLSGKPYTEVDFGVLLS